MYAPIVLESFILYLRRRRLTTPESNLNANDENGEIYRDKRIAKESDLWYNHNKIGRLYGVGLFWTDRRPPVLLSQETALRSGL